MFEPTSDRHMHAVALNSLQMDGLGQDMGGLDYQASQSGCVMKGARRDQDENADNGQEGIARDTTS